MVKKPSKKKWKCPEGCKMQDGKPCPHLEDLLPSMEQGLDRHKLSYFPRIDELWSEEYITSTMTQKQLTSFVKKLKEYGLAEHHIIILVDKYAFSKTLKEITEEHGFTSVGVVHYLLKQAEKQVKSAIERKAKQ
jgi:hypothetical protein